MRILAVNVPQADDLSKGGVKNTVGILGQLADFLKVGGKIIGVDVDQAGIIDGDYGEGMTVTSAMKGLAPTVKHLLSEVVAGNFANYGGKIETLGLVSANPEENYVQIPTASTQFEDGKFTQADYEALVAAMFAGDVTVSNDITAMPAVTNVTVEDFGNLK